MTDTPAGPDEAARPSRRRVGPPTKAQLAVMIWLAVFPTLTVLNVTLEDWLGTLAPVPRTFVLVTVAVPIVVYGLMPQLHRLRVALLSRYGAAWPDSVSRRPDRVPEDA